MMMVMMCISSWYIYIYIYGILNKFPDFFVQAFKTVVYILIYFYVGIPKSLSFNVNFADFGFS